MMARRRHTQARAAASAIRSRRVEVGPERRDPRSLLSTRQRAVWDCTARIIKLLCGRRAGKTFFACVWLLAGAMVRPGSLNVYIALTRTSAELIAWKTMRQVGLLLGLPDDCFSDSRLRVTLPNGALIVLTGSDDARTIETWRGTAIYRAVIDEMGSQIPQQIAYFVGDILWPALADERGALLLLGTPGLVCDGYWWEQTKPEIAERDPSVFSWTIHENPFFEDAQLVLDETLREIFRYDPDERAANGEAYPLPLQFRREWLAEWVQDREGLVYPYDPDRNGLLELPQVSDTGAPIPLPTWRHIIGHDVGVVDSCAWVRWAWNPAFRGAIATGSWIEKIEPLPAAERTRQLLEDTAANTVHPVELVLDTGGMGKAHERIYRAKYGISIVPAEKLGKASAITELRGDLLSGAAKVLGTPELDVLRAQWAVLGWCPKKLVHNPNQPDHVADAALYGYRRVRHWTVKPDAHKKPPPLASDERFVYDEEQRAVAAARASLARQNRGRLDR